MLMERLLALGFTDLAQRYARLSEEEVVEESQHFAQESGDQFSGLPNNAQAGRSLQSEGDLIARGGRSDLVFNGTEDEIIENLQPTNLQGNQRSPSSMEERVGPVEPIDENVSRLAELLFGQEAQPEILVAEEKKQEQLATLGQAKDLISESSSTRLKLKEFLDNFQLVQ